CDDFDLACLDVETAVRVCRAGLSGQRGIHGSGQLGHRPGRRRTVRLSPSLGFANVERDGSAAPDAERSIGNCIGPGLGAGLPGYLSPANLLSAVDSV